MSTEAQLTVVKMASSSTGILANAMAPSRCQHIEKVGDGLNWWAVGEVIARLAPSQRFYVKVMLMTS